LKTEFRIFGGLSLFLFATAGVYAWWTSSGGAEVPHPGHLEPIGTIALILSGLLCLMCGGYFWFVSRRIDPRPEDLPDGEIADGAGAIGFFSPGSYWPFGAGLTALVAMVGVAYGSVWLLIVGCVAVLFASGGLLFEYYTGSRRTH
jgi:hypothetical protein